MLATFPALGHTGMRPNNGRAAATSRATIGGGSKTVNGRGGMYVGPGKKGAHVGRAQHGRRGKRAVTQLDGETLGNEV